MTPPNPPGEEHGTRERLLEAAERLFSEKGFAAASTREIAAAAGCNLSLIAHYFGGKEGLLRELMLRRIGEGGPFLEALKDPSLDFAERIRRWVAFMVDKFDRDHHFMAIVHREVASGNHPGMVAEFGGIVDGYMAVIVGFIDEAKHKGQVRQDLDAPLACLTLMGMMQYYFMNRPVAAHLLGPATPALIARIKAQVIQTFLSGVLVDGGRP